MTDSNPPAPAASRRRDRRSLYATPRHSRHGGGSATAFIFKLIAAALAVVLVSGASIAVVRVWSLGTAINNNAIDISNPDDSTPPQIGAITGSFNILVVGVDNDEEQSEAFGERDATLNDVNILLHVSEDHTSATVVSLPRDLITAQPACTDPESGETSSAQRNVSLNTAFARGGLTCVVSTVADLTDLEIDYAAQMSFNAVVQMTDAVGGVSVCLAEPIEDDYSGLDLPAGTNVISGQTALAFLRTRHGVGDGSDLSRISSQQVYMSALLRQLQSDETLTNFTRLYRLANVAATNVRLSTSLTSIDTMVSMAQSLSTVDLSTMALVQYPGTTGDPDFPGKVMPDEDVAEELFAAIAADEPITLGEDSLGSGSVLDGSVPTEEPVATETPVAPVATEAPTATDGATPAPEPTSAAIEGLTGQTAAQQTCSAASG
ncbi:LytR family transcriptional attenuator [Glaciihabitans tibetensis]|uniref:LytR family transcriptional attenuator n=1 Tax=Glaciihabitans tibetensis TaxID=1266600 RepID=A0A2T0V9V5_9MICO|nr:LCP family protein [Glaciihabitans tibetensis]PRY66962.1 LytR family transcriptional attenuator [Glaciihabitans tibetensis]